MRRGARASFSVLTSCSLKRSSESAMRCASSGRYALTCSVLTPLVLSISTETNRHKPCRAPRNPCARTAAGEAADQVAFRPAQQVAQIVLAFEPAHHVARHQVFVHRVGVFRDRRGAGAAQHRAHRADRRFGGAAHDEFDLGQIEVGSDAEEIDAGQQRRQPDDRPEPDVQRAKERSAARRGARRRPADNDGITDSLGTADQVDHGEFQKLPGGKRGVRT